jgi:5'-3' exoribonuclease 2
VHDHYRQNTSQEHASSSSLTFVMGVPAFYRWLSEKYPKIQQDVLEERVKVVGGEGSVFRIPFDSTRPNPSGLECDNLYIDMNGIIHPCSHPEQGPQPKTEEEMYENVCLYVDRLFRIMRPRKLLYLAIDGVAPRAKMNQQRSRRFRAAQEAKENQEVEEHIRAEITQMGQRAPASKTVWDSNVITPGTPFMLRLSEFLRFYIRKRIATDKAWSQIRVIFSDASVPGEGEHKIMAHVRLQRSQPGYSPNLVHVLHGLDADLIMLALATHEAHFYISREEVLFGRKSQEQTERRQLENGFRAEQRQLDEEAGETAMQLLENRQKPLCRISIPILREYLAADFASCITPGQIPFTPSLERLIDDIVFLCFFVGNDFLPHLPSLDIRDGALDYLFNVYKRLLPTLGDYITNHGGQVNLSHVDVILGEVGGIEDHVFQMKHENTQRDDERRAQFNARKKQAKGRSLDAPPAVPVAAQPKKAIGKAARILEKQQERELKKEGGDVKIKASHMQSQENLKAAEELKKSLLGGGALKIKAEDGVDVAGIKSEEDSSMEVVKAEETVMEVVKTEEAVMETPPAIGVKRKLEEIQNEETAVKSEDQGDATVKTEENGVGQVGDAEDEFEDDANDDEEDEPKVEIPEVIDPQVANAFKEKVKAAQQKQLDDYSKNVQDNVRLHEAGWKDRYYTDKCKADDVEANGGREHLFRSYVMGLCWVMKYYYDGCKLLVFGPVHFLSVYHSHSPSCNSSVMQAPVGSGFILFITHHSLRIFEILNDSRKISTIWS